MPFVNLLQVVYPVGAFYFSNLATSPSSIIGGTWTQITDATIRGASGAMGYTGSDSHTITIDEMPKHNHDLKGYERSWQISVYRRCFHLKNTLIQKGIFHSVPI